MYMTIVIIRATITKNIILFKNRQPYLQVMSIIGDISILLQLKFEFCNKKGDKLIIRKILDDVLKKSSK